MRRNRRLRAMPVNQGVSRHFGGPWHLLAYQVRLRAAQKSRPDIIFETFSSWLRTWSSNEETRTAKAGMSATLTDEQARVVRLALKLAAKLVAFEVKMR